MSFNLTKRRYLSLLKSNKKKFIIFFIFNMVCAFYLTFMKGGNKKSNDTSAVSARFEAFSEKLQSFLTKEQIGCRLPKLDPFNEEMMNFMKDYGTLKCEGAPSLVSLDDKGVLRIRGDKLTSAKYTAIFRTQGSDYSVSKGEAVDIPLQKHKSGEMFGEIQVPVEYLRVDMTGVIPGKQSTEYFLNAPRKEEVDKRTLQWPGIPLSVMLVLFDSTSAANVERKMPMTHKFLKENPDAIMLKGYTIVGDGTDRALSAFLTGEHEGNNPEARKGIPGADKVDRWEWIFKEYKEKGYSTLFSEDEHNYASFNYRMLGFRDPPTDYYGRPIFVEADAAFNGCLNSQKRHSLLHQYIKTMYSSYPKRPKFSVVVHSLGHAEMNEIQWIDKEITELFQWAKQDDNTLMIFMSDHGQRFGSSRALMQGQLEERLPFISMVFPSWFKEKFPDLFRGLKQNEKVLTTPFDLHATFRHILSYPEKPNTTYGHSLFTKIDASKRTCENAGVKVHFCPCLIWDEVSSQDGVVVILVEKAIGVINANILSFTEECEKLSLKNITRALRQMPLKEVLRYKDVVWDETKQLQPTSYVLGEKAKDNMKRNAIYQIQFFASPSNAHFEVTVPFLDNKPMPIELESIHRVNKYGSQSICIQNKFPHLAYFCLCKRK